MSTEATRLVRDEGKAICQALRDEFYLNHSGQKSKTEITEILKTKRDLLEPEVFESIKEISSINDQDRTGKDLMLSFLAETVLLSKSSQVEEGILELESSSRFTIGKTKVPFRASKKALLTKSKEREIKEVEEKRESILSRLNELYLRQYAYYQRDSHDLGFSSYLNMYETTENHNSTELAENAKEFIRDTEYISRELLSWFLLKRMDLKLKDTSASNFFYLLNSFELKGPFSRINTHSLAQTILDDTKIVLPAKVMFDTEKRNGHIIGSIPYIMEPGLQMIISTNRMGSVWDYESFLQSFGRCLCYGFTNRDDYFEYTHLRDKPFLWTIADLFKNLIYEPTWLKKHLKFEAEDDFLKFIYLRRLMNLRVLCAKVIFETTLYHRQDDKKEMYTEIMQTATHCDASTQDYLFDIQPHLSSLDELKGTIMQTDLRTLLIDNYDEEWWRNKEASDFLVTLWETGGRISSSTLSQEYNLSESYISKLLETFETTLG